MQPRVLLLSQRNIAKDVLFRCPHTEFEDIICQIDSVDMLAPRAGRWHSQSYALAKRLAWHTPLMLKPSLTGVTVNKSYDLLFAVCGSLVDLLVINAVKGWEKIARTSVCLIDEMWVKELPSYKHYLETLAKFDYVMLYYSGTVDVLNAKIGDRCRFLAPGIDALLFSPYPIPPQRVVDVYSIGRRSPVTHEAILKMAQQRGRFYLHDTISGSRAINGKEHRTQFAAIAKRSRYFVVNPALVDLPAVRGDQHELGNRYFEGAASGTVMIGERPNNPNFEALFDWPDAVLNLPFGSEDIGSIVDEVERQPEWEENIRRQNVTHSLLRHDWAYRWEFILKTAGMEPMQGLSRRMERLKDLAARISAGDVNAIHRRQFAD